MKYPEYRLSMEAALPSPVHSWFRHELELRGIDSLVYTRYIIRLLQQDNEDFDRFNNELDIFSKPKPDLKRKGKKAEKRKLSATEEEKKKFAAVECLSAITDEKAGIENLVEELSSRLKDCENQASVSPEVKFGSSSSDSSEDSGTENQNPAQRYYAAFPSLHGQINSSNTSPTITVGAIWKNNPLVKQLVNVNSGDDSSSANEDAEIKKINRQTNISIPKYRRSRKNNSRNNRDSQEQRKQQAKVHVSKPANGNQKGKKEKEHSESEKTDQIPDWPPGFAKFDIEILKKLNISDTSFITMRSDSPKRPNEDLCTKVETLLKGMLLPTPEKTYKELQDVDEGYPVEQFEKIKKCTTPNLDNLPVPSGDSLKETKIHIESCQSHKGDDSPCSRDESISPELQEQEIWYTQPIDVVFHSQDDDTSSSKLRLYKRNSYPSFSPDADSSKDLPNDCIASSSSSPVFERNRSCSFVSDDSDDIWEGSVLIPAWLTEEISADQTDIETNVFSLSASLKSSSPYPGMADFHSCTSSTSDMAFTSNCSSHEALVQVHNSEDWSTNTNEEENITPTPVETKSIEGHSQPSEISLSVSLVDWSYLSQFMSESDWSSFKFDESFKMASPRRMSVTSLWHSQVLFDFTEPLYELYDVPCWQPLGNSENPLSQLWDVNAQKRPKFSPWDRSNIFPDGQIWLAENCFVYHNSVNELKIEIKDTCDQNENTLIPQISIDMLTDVASDFSVFVNKENEDEMFSVFFGRSLSMGDVPSMWEDHSSKVPDPKLSKSFELVPSEHSAFNDVPKKLLHVQSEPNLVQFRQEFNEGSQSKQPSPQEHLYLSPKTHFRPITPAFAPELCQSKSKQQVCHDLFGGLPSTKTPYQQYHTTEYGSDEESFVPKFKVKNYSKSIQTGDSFDKVESPVEFNDVEERDTPETLTLGMIEDVMGENDDIDYLITISEDLDTANTDSAYETDYGISALESDHDGGTKNTHSHNNCCYNGERKIDPNHGASDLENTHRGRDLGEAIDYSVESFVATFAHTQDWPDLSTTPQSSSEMSAPWTALEGSQYNPNCWSQSMEVFPEPMVAPTCHDETDGDKQYPGNLEGVYKWGSHDVWGADFMTDHMYSEEEAERYKNVWSTAGQDLYSVDIATSYPSTNHGVHYDLDGREPAETVYDHETTELFFPEGESFYENVAVAEFQPQDSDIIMDSDGNIVNTNEHSVVDSMADIMFPVDEGIYSMAVSGDMSQEPVDYYSVKLVYKDKKPSTRPRACQELHTSQKSYGACDLMPMPNEALLSSDLEKKWLDPEVQALRQQHKASSLQRKPCSFYLEGNCRRADCKFAHDISNLTCRFWEEGGCFKGPLCPFLHGYPSNESHRTPEPANSSPPAKDMFDLRTEEFPELSLSVKNGNNSSRRTKVSKSQNILGTNRKEKGRKGGGRRHSNKENQVEVRIVDKCSSSI